MSPSNPAGGGFAILSTTFTHLVANRIKNLTWSPPPTISGRISHGGAPVEGVTLTFSGVGTTTTTELGTYSMSVPYNWNGAMTLSSPTSATFSPTVKSYSGLVASKGRQNFTCSLASVMPLLRSQSVAAATSGPVVLLSTFGSAHWADTNIDLIQQTAELLSIAVSAGTATVTLPVGVAEPGDLMTTVVIEPSLQAVTGSPGDGVVIIQNQGGGQITPATQLPGATMLGSVTLLPVGADMVLTWDLTLLGP